MTPHMGERSTSARGGRETRGVLGYHAPMRLFLLLCLAASLGCDPSTSRSDGGPRRDGGGMDARVVGGDEDGDTIADLDEDRADGVDTDGDGFTPNRDDLGTPIPMPPGEASRGSAGD